MEKDQPSQAFATDILNVLNGAAVTVFAQDLDLKYRWIRNRPASWRAGDPVGRDESGVLPPAAAAIAAAVKRDVIATGRSQWGDLAIEADGSSTFFELFVEPDRDAAGCVVGVRGLAIDVTDRHKQAETLEAVARDLSHRTKNLLAVIQSLAVQTARNSGSTDIFIDHFRGRIQSISLSQDISIGAKRNGARLSELVERQVAPYFDRPGCVSFEGVDCYLSPNAALHVGLALYELCIAAARDDQAHHGAIRVSAEMDGADNGSAPSLRLTWQEAGDGVRGDNTNEGIEGFGRVLLERIVPAAVGGKSALTEDDTRYSLTISAREYDRGAAER